MDNLKLIIENLGLNSDSKLWDKEFQEFGFEPLPPTFENGDDILDLVSVDDFFILYDKLFYDIPKEGEINSHESLVNRSSEYSETEYSNSEIKELISEITTLRQENLNLKMSELNG